jgi:hypothetical protein
MRGRVKPPAGVSGIILAVVLALAPGRASAQGGPPLITDDPDTPGPGYWEINLSGLLEKSHAEKSWEAPRLDVNYGVGRRIQLKVEAPWLAARQTGGPMRSGAGDLTAGVKWRFLGEEGRTLAWSIYPQVEINTDHASVAKGLVDDGRQLLLPSEITLELAHVEINGEVGREVDQHGPGQWLYGLSTEAGLGHRLELLGEVHGESRGGEPTELILNAGARQKLGRQAVLMMAVGRAVRGLPAERPRLLVYAGLQLNLPGFYAFDHPQPRDGS